MRKQFIDNLIENTCLLTRRPTDALGIKHHDPGEKQTDGKDRSVKSFAQSNGSGQATHSGRMRARHTTRADEVREVDLMLGDQSRNELDQLGDRPRSYHYPDRGVRVPG